MTGSPWNWVPAQGVKKLRVLGLPGGRKGFKINLAVLTQYWRVTDRQTDSHLSIASTVLASVARVKNRPT